MSTKQALLCDDALSSSIDCWSNSAAWHALPKQQIEDCSLSIVYGAKACQLSSTTSGGVPWCRPPQILAHISKMLPTFLFVDTLDALACALCIPVATTTAKVPDERNPAASAPTTIGGIILTWPLLAAAEESFRCLVVSPPTIIMSGLSGGGNSGGGMSATLNSLLEKTSNWDKDERYMATNDLCNELQKDIKVHMSCV